MFSIFVKVSSVAAITEPLTSAVATVALLLLATIGTTVLLTVALLALLLLLATVTSLAVAVAVAVLLLALLLLLAIGLLLTIALLLATVTLVLLTVAAVGTVGLLLLTTVGTLLLLAVSSVALTVGLLLSEASVVGVALLSVAVGLLLALSVVAVIGLALSLRLGADVNVLTSEALRDSSSSVVGTLAWVPGGLLLGRVSRSDIRSSVASDDATSLRGRFHIEIEGKRAADERLLARKVGLELILSSIANGTGLVGIELSEAATSRVLMGVHDTPLVDFLKRVELVTNIITAVANSTELVDTEGVCSSWDLGFHVDRSLDVLT